MDHLNIRNRHKSNVSYNYNDPKIGMIALRQHGMWLILLNHLYLLLSQHVNWQGRLVRYGENSILLLLRVVEGMWSLCMEVRKNAFIYIFFATIFCNMILETNFSLSWSGVPMARHAAMLSSKTDVVIGSEFLSHRVLVI